MRLRDLVRRGLAVHHAGLLPIMKEVVEMLFCGGYIKVGLVGRSVGQLVAAVGQLISQL